MRDIKWIIYIYIIRIFESYTIILMNLMTVIMIGLKAKPPILANSKIGICYICDSY
jgi:hypothetical protein